MYTIGEFAAFGRVSVRMLRHYDAIGLLAPAYVDPHTGYRHYDDPQLVTLLRIVELRRLGCSLDDAAEVIAAADPDAALRVVLERRRDALSAAIADERAQLAAVESRLHQLEEGETMPTIEVEYRRVEPVTVYAASAVAPGMGPQNVGPVVDTLLGPLQAALEAAGVAYEEPGIFWYEPVPESEELRVNVSWVSSGTPVPGEGYEVVELPAIERAATSRYRGDMPGIGDAWMALIEAAAASGEHLLDPTREVYLESEGPQSEWLTELIIPVAPR